MKRLLTSIAFIATAWCSAQAAAGEPAFSQFFSGYEASFVLFDTRTHTYLRFNPQRAAERLTPCSTFKIFNSLVGLETGVLTGADHPMKWDGTRYSIEGWNKDQTLQTAIKESCVWYFQKVAAAIGPQRMQHYIDLTGYGNQDISGGITKFWLANTLKISADEQVEFLRRLYADQLPFSQKTMQTTRQLLTLKTTDKGTLHGKTGSDMKDGKGTLGWFVGYVEGPHDTYIFATNIAAREKAWGPTARTITEALLRQRGIL